jgi:arylsulfatase A-like enzyme/Flp pilus assembly protein TadD
MLAASSCGRNAAPPLKSGALQGANVLLVTIDTLRRDRLGSYGNASGLTPALDRLAASAVRYTRAYSHVPMTLPAHASILTGRTPRGHGVHNNVSFRLSEDVPTLATKLKDAGYRTGAFVGAFVLDARFGLNRSFDAYDDRYPQTYGAASFKFAERRADDVVRPAGDWILQGDRRPGIGLQPFFAWVHLFDPHAPYDAPAEYRSGRSAYDAEVAYTDAALGSLFDRLRNARALDRTLIVVTADHGESLGEHGETTHGLFAYDATLSVPLIIAGPGIQPRTIDQPVAHADIMPTVLDLLGVAAPANLDGTALLTATAGLGDAVARPIYFEALDANLTRDWAPLTGLVRGDWKYIDLPVAELYDIRSDSAEMNNLAGREAGQRDAMARALGEIVARAGRASSAAPAIDGDAAARLRALGYTGGSAPHRARYSDADDPKRLAPLNERFNTALDEFNQGRGADALRAFEAILGERPDFVTARTSAATVLLAAGRPKDAIALLRQAPAEQADWPELLAKSGAALLEAGDFTNAAAALERARRAGSQNPDVLNDLAVVYARLGRDADARAIFNELLRRDPRAASTWYNLGLLELERRQPEAAAGAFRHAVDADASYGDAWQALGAALVERDRDAAIEAWRHAEQLRPRDYDLLFNLGMILADSPRPADAVPFLERFVREAPRDRYARDIPRVQATLARIRQ